MFKRVANYSLIILSALACTLGVMSPVSALETGDIVMQVRPSEQEIELIPGEQYRGSIEMSNIGRLPFNFTASTHPYQIRNDDYEPDFSTETNYTKLNSWIKLDRTEYHLEPNESIDVEFEIDVPTDAPAGGQYAAVIFETSDSIDENATTKTLSQLASLILAHVAGEDRVDGSLLFQDIPGFLLGSPISSTVGLKNDGNVDFRANNTMTVYDFFTNREVFVPDAVSADGHMPGTATPLILPATSRTSRLTWEDSPQLGVFRVVSQVDFLDQSHTEEKIIFVCPIWLAVIVVFFIALMILWIILCIRKHRQNRPQVV